MMTCSRSLLAGTGGKDIGIALAEALRALAFAFMVDLAERSTCFAAALFSIENTVMCPVHLEQSEQLCSLM